MLDGFFFSRSTWAEWVFFYLKAMSVFFQVLGVSGSEFGECRSYMVRPACLYAFWFGSLSISSTGSWMCWSPSLVSDLGLYNTVGDCDVALVQTRTFGCKLISNLIALYSAVGGDPCRIILFGVLLAVVLHPGVSVFRIIGLYGCCHGHAVRQYHDGLSWVGVLLNPFECKEKGTALC